MSNTVLDRLGRYNFITCSEPEFDYSYLILSKIQKLQSIIAIREFQLLPK